MFHRSFASLPAIFLLAFSMAGCATTQPASPQYLLSNYGAVGDGKTVNTHAIQGAIDNIASAGGGTLVVPPGTYLTGAIFFKPSVSLLIEKDGVIKGTTNQADYPLVSTRWEGVEGMHTSALVNFDDSDHISLSGEGTSDGAGDQWGGRGGRGGGFGGGGFGRGGAVTQPGARGGRGGRGGGGLAGGATRPAGTPSGSIRMADGFVFQQIGRPRLICFKNCHDVEISNLHFQKQAIWCLHLLYCQNVKVENLNIDSVARTPSSDGMDIDSSRDIEVSHCTISCNDDDITLKSGKDNDGRRVNRPTENVWIHDCDIRLGDGIAMGSEVTGSVRHVLVENCTFTNTTHAARIKSQPSRGGIVEDIVYRNIVLKNAGEAVDFELAWDLRLQRLPATPILTVCRNVRLIHFTGVARSGGTLAGIEGGPITDVHFSDCNFSAQRGLRITHAADIDTSGLTLKVQNGLPLIIGNPPARQAQPRG